MSTGSLADAPVDDGEKLARFILTERHIRKSDKTVKPEALIPSPHIELSVTRHRGFSDDEVWSSGNDVAIIRNRPLIGRADFNAADARQQKLDVKPDEPPRNHANIIGWPPEKSSQLALALEMSLRATFISLPI